MLPRIASWLLLLTIGVAIGIAIGNANNPTAESSLTATSPETSPLRTVSTGLGSELSANDATDSSPNVTENSFVSSYAQPVDIQRRQTLTDIQALPTEFDRYLASYQLVQHADPHRIESLINEALNLADIHASLSFCRIFLSRYLSLDPQQAFQYYLNTIHPVTSHRRILFELFHEWIQLDLAEALNNLGLITPLQLQKRITLAIFADPVVANRKELVAFAQKLSLSMQQAAARAEYRQLSPDQAFEQVFAQNTNNPQHARALRGAIYRWARTDPEAAFKRVSELTEARQQQEWLGRILRVWSEDDNNSAWKHALQADNGNGHLLSAVLTSMSKQQGEQAMELANQQNKRISQFLRNRVIATWAGSEPRAAIDYWQNQSSQFDTNNNTIHQLARIYADKQPRDAFYWSVDMEMPLPVMRTVAEKYVNKDPGDAMRFFNDLPSGTTRKAMLSGIANYKAQQSYPEAIAWLDRYASDDSDRRIRHEVTTRWIQQDPAAASEFVGAGGYETSKVSHVATLVHTWFRQDPVAVENWVEELPQDKIKNNALKILIFKLAPSDPDHARSLLTRISDPQLSDSIERQLEKQGL